MNLQSIQKRVEELSAELLTLSNDLSHLLEGNVYREVEVIGWHDWASGLECGDHVICIGFTTYAGETQKRCFTIGTRYIVESRLSSSKVDHKSYGIRVVHDDERQGHDAIGVRFRKVGA